MPILLMWMGFGSSSKVALAAIFGFFPILAGARAGVHVGRPRPPRPGHHAAGHAAATALFLFELPSALPAILTGMEVGMVLATVGAVVGEYLSGGQGLGFLVGELHRPAPDRRRPSP